MKVFFFWISRVFRAKLYFKSDLDLAQPSRITDRRMTFPKTSLLARKMREILFSGSPAFLLIQEATRSNSSLPMQIEDALHFNSAVDTTRIS